MVDPEALKAQAQGIPYDIDARRNAIAAQVQAQQQAAAAAAAAAQQQPQGGGGFGQGGWTDPFAQPNGHRMEAGG
jgi:hypothetical protein